MATKTWVGSVVNNNWTTAANWFPSAPATGDDVIFDGVAPLGNNNCVYNVTTAISLLSINFTGYTGQFTFSNNLTVTGNITLSPAAGASYATSATVTTYTITTSTATTLTFNGKSLPVNYNPGGTGTQTFVGDADFQGNYVGQGTAYNIKAAALTNINLRIGGNIGFGQCINNTTEYVTLRAYGVNKTIASNSTTLNQRVVFASGSSYKNTSNYGTGGASFYTVETGGQFNALNNILNNSSVGTLTLSGFNSANNSDFMSINGIGTYNISNDTVIKGFIQITNNPLTINSPTGGKILLEGNLLLGAAPTTIDYLEFSGTALSTISGTVTPTLQIKNLSFNKTGAGSVNITATSFTLTIAANSTYSWTHTAGTITQSTNSRISIACLNTASQLIYSESIALSTPFTFSTLSFNGGILSLNSTLRATRLYLTLSLTNTTTITSSGTLGFNVDILSIINSSAALRFLTLKIGCTYNINVQLYMTSLSGSAGQITLASSAASSYTYFNLDNNASQFVEYVTAVDIDSSGTLGVPTFTKQLIYNLQGVLTRTIHWALGAQPPPVLPSRTVAYTFVN